MMLAEEQKASWRRMLERMAPRSLGPAPVISALPLAASSSQCPSAVQLAQSPSCLPSTSPGGGLPLGGVSGPGQEPKAAEP